MEKTSVEIGGQSSEKLKQEYEDSHFLSPEFDGAIMGVNPLTGSIIYHLDTMIDLTMAEQFGDNAEEDEMEDDDIYDNCLELVYGYFKAFEYYKDKVAPTLFQEPIEIDN